MFQVSRLELEIVALPVSLQLTLQLPRVQVTEARWPPFLTHASANLRQARAEICPVTGDSPVRSSLTVVELV